MSGTIRRLSDADLRLRDLERENARRKSPCNRKPAQPASAPEVFWGAVEAKTHLNYRVMVRWDAVTTDEHGFPDDTISAYEVEVMAIDASGDPVERKNGNPLVRYQVVTKPGKEGGDADAWMMADMGAAPNPKRWRWKARYHAQSNGCWGAWSAWTAPALPSSATAEPLPPAPTYSAFIFDTAGQTKSNKIRGRVEFQPVRNWDVPGGDTEDDLSRYAVKIEVQEGGSGSWEKHSIHTVEDKDDGEASESIFVPFFRVRRGNRYRVRLRSVDRFNRRGAWSGPHPSSSGVAVSLAGPIGLTTKVTQKSLAGVSQRIQFDWPDIDNEEEFDRYKLEVYYSATRTGTYTLTKTVYPKQSEYRYAVPTSEIGGFFKGVVSVQGEKPPDGSSRPESDPSPTPTNTEAAQDDQPASSGVADGSITTAKLADDAVTAAKIAASAVGASEIADGSVGSAELASLAVTTGKIDSLAVTTGKIDDLAVTTAKIGLQAVDTPQITNGAVSFAKLMDAAVNTAKIADGAVTTVKIADAAVTDTKIASATIGLGKLKQGGAAGYYRWLYWSGSQWTPYPLLHVYDTAGALNLNGEVYVNSTSHRLYWRSGGSWRSVVG